jgi:hypothetical protein
LGRLISSPTSVFNAAVAGAFAVMAPLFGVFLVKTAVALGHPRDALVVGIIGLICMAIGGALGALCFAVPVMLKNWLYQRIQDVPSDHQAMK